MPDPKPRIVRPFGLIGGDYEVDAARLRKYRVACVVAVAGIALMIFGRLIDAPDWLAYGAATAGLLITIAICADVARNGRKL